MKIKIKIKINLKNKGLKLFHSNILKNDHGL